MAIFKKCQTMLLSPSRSNAFLGSGCRTAVEHTPAEQNSWGRGFDSRQVCCDFLLHDLMRLRFGESGKRGFVCVGKKISIEMTKKTFDSFLMLSKAKKQEEGKWLHWREGKTFSRATKQNFSPFTAIFPPNCGIKILTQWREHFFCSRLALSG